MATTVGHIVHRVTDLKNQIGDLRLQIEATEADLAQRREHAQVADTTVAWLNLLREPAEEIEDDTPEAFIKRQQLVRLLVGGITLGRDEDGDATVEVTYRWLRRPRRRSQRSRKTTANSNRRTTFL